MITLLNEYFWKKKLKLSQMSGKSDFHLPFKESNFTKIRESDFLKKVIFYSKWCTKSLKVILFN